MQVKKIIRESSLSTLSTHKAHGFRTKSTTLQCFWNETKANPYKHFNIKTVYAEEKTTTMTEISECRSLQYGHVYVQLIFID